MAKQRMDGMHLDPEEVLVALSYRYTISRHDKAWKLRVFREAYSEYHDAYSPCAVKREYRTYLESGEIPFFVLRLGGKIMRNAQEQAYIHDWINNRRDDGGKTPRLKVVGGN